MWMDGLGWLRIFSWFGLSRSGSGWTWVCEWLVVQIIGEIDGELEREGELDR